MPVRGLDELRAVLGKNLTGAYRYVLASTKDAFGHGITELEFENTRVVIRPGPNEDYLVVEQGPLDSTSLRPEYWTKVELFKDSGWQLKEVSVFTDGTEDVALVFAFRSGQQFSIVLCDTDVAIGRDLELFETDPNKIHPVFRTSIAL